MNASKKTKEVRVARRLIHKNDCSIVVIQLETTEGQSFISKIKEKLYSNGQRYGGAILP